MRFDLELFGRRALVTAGTKGVGAAVRLDRADGELTRFDAFGDSNASAAQ